jgi:hypothetical protein
MADENKFVLQADIDNKLALEALEEIEQRSGKLGQSADQNMKKIGTSVAGMVNELRKAPAPIDKVKKSFVDAFKDGKISAEQFRKKVQQLLADVKKLDEIDPGPKFDPNVFAFAGEGPDDPSRVFKEGALSEFESFGAEIVDTEAAQRDLEEIRAIIDALKESIVENSNEAAVALEGQLQGALIKVGGEANATREDMEALLAQGKEMADLFVEGKAKTQLSENLGIIEADAKLEELRKTGQRLTTSLSKDARTAGKEIVKEADKLKETFDPKNVQQYTKDVNKLAAETKRFSKEADKAFKRDVNKDLNLKKAVASFKDLGGVIKRLSGSGDKELQNLGNTIKDTANKWIQAFNEGKIGADRLEKELRDLEKTGRKLGNVGEKVEKGSERGTRSIWKLGRAFDSLGVRGGGNALRVVDALSGINPVVAVAGLSLVGLILVLKKVGEAAIEMAKKISSAFVGLVKDALSVAESLEIVEAQIRNLVGGSTELARASLEEILELGAKLGVDLSGEFAQIFLPLVDGFEQFERLGEIAATFAAKTGKDVGDIAKILTQASADQFRNAQRTLKLNTDQVDKIRAKMEKLGEIPGLIAGFEEYFETTETGWNTFEGSLRRVRGQLEQTFKILKFALGEPVKIAAVEQLDKFLDWIEDNRQSIENFLVDVGDAVSGVIGSVGDVIGQILDDVDPKTFQDLGVQIKVIGEQIEIIFRQFGAFSADSVVDGLFWVLELVERIIKLVQRMTAEFQIFGATANLDYFRELKAALEGDQSFVDFWKFFFDTYIDGFEKGSEASEEFNTTRERILGNLENEQSEVAKLREEWEAEAKARAAAGEVDDEENLRQADSWLNLNALMEERAQKLVEITEATKELSEAQADLDKEMGRAFADIFIEEGRRIADLAIANQNKRIDLARKHRQNLAAIDIREDRLEEDRVQDHDDKIEDIDIEHGRRIRDQAVSEARKKEDLLKKHLRRLEEIRARFDFDAGEAVRANDIVALLRIRRRMDLELRLEKKKFEDSTEDATEAEKRKQKDLEQMRQDDVDDAERANERKIRDNEIRIQREIDDEREKFNQLLKQQSVEEERKAKELAVWLNRELADFNRMWDQKKQDLADNMRDVLTVYQTALRRVFEINQQMAQAMMNNPFMAGSFFSGSGAPPPGGTSTGSPSESTGVPNAGSDTDGGDMDSMELNHLRTLALEWGKKANQPTSVLIGIDSMNKAELIQFIQDMQERVSSPGRQFGGITNSGVDYTVGEDGPEAFRPMQHGIIVPHNPMMFNPQSQAASNMITNDHSRNVNADISLLDPSHLSAVQKTLIRSVVTEMVLDLGI